MQVDQDGQDNPNAIPDFSNDAEAWLHSEVFRLDDDGYRDDWDQPDQLVYQGRGDVMHDRQQGGDEFLPMTLSGDRISVTVGIREQDMDIHKGLDLIVDNEMVS